MLKTRLILPLAFASVAFMYGCQEQGSELVGPDGVATQGTTQAAKGGNKGKPPKNDSGGATVTVTLGGGMTGELTNVKVFSDNNKKFAMNTDPNQSAGVIAMNFDIDTDECVAEPDNAETEAVDRVKRLKAQLGAHLPNANNSLFTLFNVKVDRTALGDQDKGHDLQFTYDPVDGGGGIILGWAHRDRAAVSEEAGTFTFSGGQIRVGEEEGSPRDRIRILCPSKDVTVTVTVD